jgi:hypothetical protein
MIRPYGKTYGGVDPQLIEGDVFQMTIGVPEFSDEATTGTDTVQPRLQSGGQSAAWVAKVWRSSLGVTRIGKPASSPAARTMRRIQLTVIGLPRVL